MLFFAEYKKRIRNNNSSHEKDVNMAFCEGLIVNGLHMEVDEKITDSEGNIENKSFDIKIESNPQYQKENKLGIEDIADTTNNSENEGSGSIKECEKSGKKKEPSSVLDIVLAIIFLVAILVYFIFYFRFNNNVVAIAALIIALLVYSTEIVINEKSLLPGRNYNMFEVIRRSEILIYICKQYNLYNSKSIKWLIENAESEITADDNKKKISLDNIAAFASIIALIMDSMTGISKTIYAYLSSEGILLINISTQDRVLLLVFIFFLVVYVILIVSLGHFWQMCLIERNRILMEDMKENLEYILLTKMDFRE